MANYKDKKILDGSVAGEFDVCNISRDEKVPFEIENEDGDWLDNYLLKIYNSERKNTLIVNSTVGVIGNKMLFSIEPKLDGDLSKGNYYFEIFNDTVKRIEFKGALQIID